MRIAVTGRRGQVATALIERAPIFGVTIVPVGRPHFDLAAPENADAIFAEISPDLVVSAAAYTSVDQAEREPDVAFAINATAAGFVGRAAARLRVPVIYLSTDYVFDGSQTTPWLETDAAHPIGFYGASKRAGEEATSAATDDATILRLSWVFAPFGANFLRTMLHIAETRDRVSVVSDQIGVPTSALDIADGIIAVARNLISNPQDQSLRGIYHMPASGPDTSWADYAQEIFEKLSAYNIRVPVLDRITTADYPTLARRPAYSRLSGEKLATNHGVVLPDWRTSLETVVDRLARRLPKASVL